MSNPLKVHDVHLYVILSVLTAILSAQLSITALAQTNDALLIYGVTGSNSTGSYSTTMRNIAVQKLLLDLAAQPRSSKYVKLALSGTNVSLDDLVDLGLVKLIGDEFFINFYLITKTDERRVRDVTETHSRDLAASFLANRNEIEQVFQSYSLKGVDSKAVAYVLLGCFSLDWDGLNCRSL